MYKRKTTDNLNQLWVLEPYQQIEGALNMATTSVPLHKKEGFGQPRPGYAAEPGVPPELTKVPENNRIAGVGNNISPTPTTTNTGNSRVDPILSQYGSFYGGTATSPPPPQQGPVPSKNSNYPPPPLPPKNSTIYPPQPIQVASPSNFPAPIPPSNTTSTYPPPVSPTNYPSTSPPNTLNFPSPTTSSSGYPPTSPTHFNSGYPGNTYPPSTTNNGMPMPMGYNNQQPMMPSVEHYNNKQDHTGYPVPPPLPAKRPDQNNNQYGYSSYPPQ